MISRSIISFNPSLYSLSSIIISLAVISPHALPVLIAWSVVVWVIKDIWRVPALIEPPVRILSAPVHGVVGIGQHAVVVPISQQRVPDSVRIVVTSSLRWRLLVADHAVSVFDHGVVLRRRSLVSLAAHLRLLIVMALLWRTVNKIWNYWRPPGLIGRPFNWLKVVIWKVLLTF